ncbi:hypothetical protein, partial [Cardiobacterium valvarum]|uniref:hypothetical protein n=1 Tax=Cardiobacterium valvarum TaxID=194702 RepID=UPI001C11FFD7
TAEAETMNTFLAAVQTAQQHYGRKKNVETLPATSQNQKARSFPAWWSRLPEIQKAGCTRLMG